ncbi:hypothetical protein [Aeromonas cavernicola]|uniref:Phage coat protein n=1 Tax=Aeromonas cavernicola TaxID=1006623 RepID=A0A2H9U485_9GAMM|nr:hypothetical protein [Aeromonas cavernicola]PJG58830.1 hypothetical protein CUC53_10405 [Aeromonas cavernicola]
MQKIKSFFNGSKKLALIPAVAVMALASMPASAAISDEIQTAIANGTANYGTVTAGVITVAALGFCVGMIVSWLRK